MADREYLKRLSREFADKGKLIEAGWLSLRAVGISNDASPVQVSEMRMAFMAGAQHLFASMLEILDPGVEPTNTDMRRMDLIRDELDAFVNELRLRHNKPEGSA